MLEALNASSDKQRAYTAMMRTVVWPAAHTGAIPRLELVERGRHRWVGVGHGDMRRLTAPARAVGGPAKRLRRQLGATRGGKRIAGNAVSVPRISPTCIRKVKRTSPAAGMLSV